MIVVDGGSEARNCHSDKISIIILRERAVCKPCGLYGIVLVLSSHSLIFTHDLHPTFLVHIVTLSHCFWIKVVCCIYISLQTETIVLGYAYNVSLSLGGILIAQSKHPIEDQTDKKNQENSNSNQTLLLPLSDTRAHATRPVSVVFPQHKNSGEKERQTDPKKTKHAGLENGKQPLWGHARREPSHAGLEDREQPLWEHACSELRRPKMARSE